MCCRPLWYGCDIFLNSWKTGTCRIVLMLIFGSVPLKKKCRQYESCMIYLPIIFINMFGSSVFNVTDVFKKQKCQFEWLSVKLRKNFRWRHYFINYWIACSQNPRAIQGNRARYNEGVFPETR